MGPRMPRGRLPGKENIFKVFESVGAAKGRIQRVLQHKALWAALGLGAVLVGTLFSPNPLPRDIAWVGPPAVEAAMSQSTPQSRIWEALEQGGPKKQIVACYPFFLSPWAEDIVQRQVGPGREPVLFISSDNVGIEAQEPVVSTIASAENVLNNWLGWGSDTLKGAWEARVRQWLKEHADVQIHRIVNLKFRGGLELKNAQVGVWVVPDAVEEVTQGPEGTVKVKAVAGASPVIEMTGIRQSRWVDIQATVASPSDSEGQALRLFEREVAGAVAQVLEGLEEGNARGIVIYGEVPMGENERASVVIVHGYQGVESLPIGGKLDRLPLSGTVAPQTYVAAYNPSTNPGEKVQFLFEYVFLGDLFNVSPFGHVESDGQAAAAIVYGPEGYDFLRRAGIVLDGMQFRGTFPFEGVIERDDEGYARVYYDEAAVFGTQAAEDVLEELFGDNRIDWGNLLYTCRAFP